MMIKRILFLGTICVFLFSCAKVRQMECDNREKLLSIWTEKYHCDTVMLKYAVLKEEIYFKPLVCIMLTMENPTLETVDFKSLQSNRFAQYDKVKNKLFDELLVVKSQIESECELQDATKILIEIVSENSKGDYVPWFTLEYDLE